MIFKRLILTHYHSSLQEVAFAIVVGLHKTALQRTFSIMCSAWSCQPFLKTMIHSYSFLIQVFLHVKNQTMNQINYLVQLAYLNRHGCPKINLRICVVSVLQLLGGLILLSPFNPVHFTSQLSLS